MFGAIGNGVRKGHGRAPMAMVTHPHCGAERRLPAGAATAHLPSTASTPPARPAKHWAWCAAREGRLGDAPWGGRAAPARSAPIRRPRQRRHGVPVRRANRYPVASPLPPLAPTGDAGRRPWGSGSPGGTKNPEGCEDAQRRGERQAHEQWKANLFVAGKLDAAQNLWRRFANLPSRRVVCYNPHGIGGGEGGQMGPTGGAPRRCCRSGRRRENGRRVLPSQGGRVSLS